ncbi:hypothetical protein NDU88_006311 [Pleurodeles waltl]|uniref:Uncharacterized protein n=1 Tax=Pleurodeles waltl TaxID=8319 RepID=A0AAV7VP90_PLEWA|nr:hypothetical protein NDU88_006311 [Pleurodeles waltl]
MQLHPSGAGLNQWLSDGKKPEAYARSLCITTVVSGEGTDQGTDARSGGGGAHEAEVEGATGGTDAASGEGGVDKAEEVEGVAVAKEVATANLPASASSIFF